MSGVFVTMEGAGLDGVLASLNRMGQPRRVAEGLANIGGLVEAQTLERFETKIAPDGEAWTPWSETYATTRKAGQSLLVASGAFSISPAWDLSADELTVGSNMVQAALHQEGGTDDMAPGPAAVPARPWLGISDDNARDIENTMNGWIEELLQ